MRGPGSADHTPLADEVAKIGGVSRATDRASRVKAMVKNLGMSVAKEC
jgi:hypothetical protein